MRDLLLAFGVTSDRAWRSAFGVIAGLLLAVAISFATAPSHRECVAGEFHRDRDGGEGDCWEYRTVTGPNYFAAATVLFASGAFFVVSISASK